MAAVARTVYRAGNVLEAGLVVVLVVSPGGNLVDFDAGRAAESMMLSALGRRGRLVPQRRRRRRRPRIPPRAFRRPSARWW